MQTEDRHLLTRYKQILKTKEYEDYYLESDLYDPDFIDSFSGYILGNLRKDRTFDIDTCAVSIDKSGNLTLLYNPIFFCQLTEGERKLVLLHEVHHIVLEHLTNLAGLSENPDDRRENILLNIAGDLTINGSIEFNPAINNFRWVSKKGEICKPIIPGYGDFQDFLRGQSTEYYYFEMLKNIEKYSGPRTKYKSRVEAQFDEHDWDNAVSNGENSQMSEEMYDRLKEKISDIVSKGKDKAARGELSYGRAPKAIKKEIEQQRKKYELDPVSILNRFVKASIKNSSKKTITKLSRRNPYIQRGKITERRPHIAVAIDQSASVNCRMLEFFAGWLKTVVKHTDITIIPFDTKVYKERRFRKGETLRVDRVARGGTDFNPVTKYVNQKQFDGVIMLTDLEAYKPERCRHRRIWVTDDLSYRRMYMKPDEPVLNLGRR